MKLQSNYIPRSVFFILRDNRKIAHKNYNQIKQNVAIDRYIDIHDYKKKNQKLPRADMRGGGEARKCTLSEEILDPIFEISSCSNKILLCSHIATQITNQSINHKHR